MCSGFCTMGIECFILTLECFSGWLHVLMETKWQVSFGDREEEGKEGHISCH